MCAQLINGMVSKYLKTAGILLVIFILVRLVPDGTIDPWNILSPKKAVAMILALALIQWLGAVMTQLLGSRAGTMLSGFFAGLISSTAATVSLARQSRQPTKKDSATETLTFLCANLAMLAESAAILYFGAHDLHRLLFLIFVVPAAITTMMIFFQSRRTQKQESLWQEPKLDFLPILKLALFILAILAASKIIQIFIGERGFYLLTFVVSLFEIHGSLIANIQLHNSGAFDVRFLGSLLTISVAASYISKMFLIFTLGSPSLKVETIKYTSILMASLLTSWFVFYLILTGPSA